MPTTGAKNNIQLVEMRGLDYDDPQWDKMCIRDSHQLLHR